MNKIGLVRLVILCLSLVETILVIEHALGQMRPPVLTHPFLPPLLPNDDDFQLIFSTMSSNSLILATAGWFTVGLMTWWGRRLPNAWKEAGIDSDVFNLMVKMRGASSRLAVLQHLDPPSHRTELSEVLGLDWKEVDRNLSILQKHGLVSIIVTSGSIKMYGLTNLGRAILRLVSELNQPEK
ncbi:MAG: hypothetical protein JRN15_05110 [Nitrososphaerota archaeon]|nr:hypothetical protein [Nitrososphaerota archaeon]